MEVGLLRAEPAGPVLTVSQLALLIRGALQESLGTVWVAGELSNLRIPSSGHCYFTLKDDQAQVAAVMFRSYASALVFAPEDGMEVLARGRVDFYSRRGDLQLYVELLEPRGLGALQIALEQRKARLAAEGLFAPERKRPLPRYPRCVGVVTAVGGAAIRDVLTVLRARWPACRVLVRPVRVQGAGAATEIASGIADMNDSGEAEVLIVGRGGGSVEDLWAFNEEVVARAIADARVPVISAVGHEIDYTIADLVADARAPTPTAAAEMAVPRRDDVICQVAALAEALGGTLRRRVAERRQAAQALARRLRAADPRRRAAIQRERCAGLAVRLRAALERRIGGMRARLGGAAGRLDELSPLRVLERGYSLVEKRPEGFLVRDAGQLRPGDELRIRFARGKAQARVIEAGGS